jgi:hypothetical protein
MDQLLESLQAKLHPSRFPNMSGKMVAILAFILEVEGGWTRVRIEEIVRTSDNYLMGRHAGDIGCNAFLGTFDQLTSNWDRLLAIVPDLTDEERAEAQKMFDKHVRDSCPWLRLRGVA